MAPEQSVSQLVPWMDYGICDVSIHDEIAGIKYSKLDALNSFLLGQTQITNLLYKSYSTWKLDLLTLIPTRVLNSFYKSDEEWPITFQKSGNLVLVDILDPKILAHWIKINSSIRYLCIPISLTPEYETDSAHACSLIIDNALNEIYFFDPNGETGYFGSQISSDPIDKLFEYYFKDFELDYTYVPNLTIKMYELNRNFSSFLMANSGNCMILSIMIPHFLSLTQNEISMGISKLGELGDTELAELINGYSIGIGRHVLAT